MDCVKKSSALLLTLNFLLAFQQVIPTDMLCITAGIDLFPLPLPLAFLLIQRLEFCQSTICHGHRLIAVFLDTTTSH